MFGRFSAPQRLLGRPMPAMSARSSAALGSAFLSGLSAFSLGSLGSQPSPPRSRRREYAAVSRRRAAAEFLCRVADLSLRGGLRQRSLGRPRAARASTSFCRMRPGIYRLYSFDASLAD